MPKEARLPDGYVDPDTYGFVEEQRAANAVLRAEGALLPRAGSVDPATIRRRRLYNKDGSFKPTLVDTARDGLVATPFGDILTRTFPADDAVAVMVHFHGGGWSLGSVYEQDELLSQLALRTGTRVVSVDYPLAPESELPRTLEVATAAMARIIVQHLDVPVGIIGESAGAHVALSTILRLPPELRTRVHAMSLAYGIYDLSMTPSQRSWGSDTLGISTDWLEWFYALALPGRSRDVRSNSAFSPLYAELTGLPQTIFSIGALDPLLDDTLFLFQRWQAAGNSGQLNMYPEAPHGFNHLQTRMAAHCNEAVSTFLADRLRLPRQ